MQSGLTIEGGLKQVGIVGRGERDGEGVVLEVSCESVRGERVRGHVCEGCRC